MTDPDGSRAGVKWITSPPRAGRYGQSGELLTGENRPATPAVPQGAQAMDASSEPHLSSTFLSEGSTMKIRSIIAAPIALVAAGLFLAGCGQAQIPGNATVSAAAAV